MLNYDVRMLKRETREISIKFYPFNILTTSNKSVILFEGNGQIHPAIQAHLSEDTVILANDSCILQLV